MTPVVAILAGLAARVVVVGVLVRLYVTERVLPGDLGARRTAP